MINFIKSLFKPKIQPMNLIQIDKKSMLHNFEYLKSLHPQADIFPVLKSNAYWHWLDQILEIYKSSKVPYLAVDSFPEYSIIERHSNHNILLLGETLPKNYKYFNLKRTTFAVYNLETLHILWKRKKNLKIHLFLNTWMNREWIQPQMLHNILETLKSYPQITVEGVLSHFYSADTPDNLGVNQQIELFKTMYHQILEYWHTPIYRHIWASAGLLKLNDDFFNAYRPWLALYWYNPFSTSDPHFTKWQPLQPALSLTSTIIALNEVKASEWVSYFPQFVIANEAKQSIIATIPFWYYEWLPRLLKEKISFSRNDKLFPQVWAICMNLTSLIWDKDMLIWDKIKIIEKKSDSDLSVQYLAQQMNSIPYEFLVKLDKWIRREIIN